MMDTTRETVQEYYGKVLTSSTDLKTDACCSGEKPPARVRQVLSKIHETVLARYYGCGLVVPPDMLLEGLSVLDLGCGSGRDCFVLSALVGPMGHIVGVDMTQEQIDVAQEHVDYHTTAFGYKQPNVRFIKAFIEDLSQLPDSSFDLVISNCVVNLSNDKPAVLREAHRVLKQGGELFFSDIYADSRVPDSLHTNKMLWGECLSGALYWNDFLSIAKAAGFPDCRLLKSNRLGIKNTAIEALVGNIRFYSATYRLFKLDSIEPDCEDYGQAIKYLGTITDTPASFTLDGHHVFEAHRFYSVCGNTFDMLALTRYRQYFELLGDRTVHFGIFPGCGKRIPFTDSATSASSSGGCC